MAKKVMVTLVCIETHRSKRVWIRNDFGMQSGYALAPGARLNVTKNWYNSIPEATSSTPPQSSAIEMTPTCPHCNGTGEHPEVQFGNFGENLDLNEGATLSSALNENPEHMRRIMQNPHLQQQAALREQQLRSATGPSESKCGHCSGSGQMGGGRIII